MPNRHDEPPTIEEKIARLERHLVAAARRLRDMEVELAILRGEFARQRESYLATVRVLDSLHTAVKGLAEGANEPPAWDEITDPRMTINLETAVSGEALKQILHNLGEHWDIDELAGLCLGLNVKHENLAGGTRRAKCQALVEMMQRYGRLAELVQVAQAERPFLAWPRVE